MSKLILNETICAPATSSGRGAISVIRVSGPESISAVAKIFSSRKGDSLNDANGYSILYGSISKEGKLIDDVLVSVFKAPHSYTGEDSVEISCHGSNYIVQEIISTLLELGIKMAEPGEFTKIAFLNGKMDLTQAEAVSDLISAETSSSHKVALQQMKGGFSNELSLMRKELLNFVSLMELELDFSDEEVEFADREQLKIQLENITRHVNELASSFKLGNAIKNGVPVAIVGATNTGKSTLLNAILGEERAIVSPIHGTTRDAIEDTINLDGILFRFIDTAGIRKTKEEIENIGIERTYETIKKASIVILMLDYKRPEAFTDAITIFKNLIDQNQQQVIILINKCDDHITASGEFISEVYYSNIVSVFSKTIGLKPLSILNISAKNKFGLKNLLSVLVESQKNLTTNPDAVLVTNIRHYEALREASSSLSRVSDGIKDNIPTDLLTQDIREALYHIGSIVGEVSTDEILGNIFKNFCIGK
ncbi:MAG: tRNA uridine-5-carboxymethylaminomethyl(34) synthesis GTPase MnmE [Bacteroidales bacterium]|jgi:tRNA modification GTPase